MHYRTEPAMSQLEATPEGFRWIDGSVVERSLLAFLRCGVDRNDDILIVFNFTPVPRHNYRVGVPSDGYWRKLLNSDSHSCGGSGVGNVGGLLASPVPCHGQMFSLNLTLPPLGVVFCKRGSEKSHPTRLGTPVRTLGVRFEHQEFPKETPPCHTFGGWKHGYVVGLLLSHSLFSGLRCHESTRRFRKNGSAASSPYTGVCENAGGHARCGG